MFIRACHLSLSRAKLIQSMPHHPTSFWSTLILFFHLCLRFPIGLFPSGTPSKILHAFVFSPIFGTCYTHLIQLIMPDNEYKSQKCITRYLGMHFDSGTGIPLFLSSLALFWLQGSVVPIQPPFQMALILDFHPPITYKQFFRHPKTFPMLKAYLKISDTFRSDINIKRAFKI